jgi:hypothetical protein
VILTFSPGVRIPSSTSDISAPTGVDRQQRPRGRRRSQTAVIRTRSRPGTDVRTLYGRNVSSSFAIIVILLYCRYYCRHRMVNRGARL